MAKVTEIREYRARNIRATLERLIALVDSGEMTGLAFACKIGDSHHGIGLAGDYREDPVQVLAVTARINYRINQILDNEREPDTNFGTL